MSTAGHVAAAEVYGDGSAAVTDTQLDRPVRYRWPGPGAAALFGLPLLLTNDPLVDPVELPDVVRAQSVQDL